MTAPTMPTSVEERVRALVEEVLQGTPHFLVDLDVRGARGSQVATVYLDSDASMDLDTLARVSRDLEFLLETEEVFPSKYTLNVSSPGVDRPLKHPRQYRKNVGRSLHVHHRRADGEGNTDSRGTLTAADDAGVTLELASGAEREIPYADILWAKVQLPW